MKVDIKEEIVYVLENRVKETKDFRNVEEYINYILSQVVDKLSGEKDKNVFSKEDEKKIKEKLKSLGYLD